MPKGTKVERLYEKLKAQGKPKDSAAAITQSATGLALATGKPPKSQNSIRNMVEGDSSVVNKMVKGKKKGRKVYGNG